MPGEDTTSALAAAAELERSRLGSVLTVLGENVSNESESAATAREYVELLGRIHSEGRKAEVSVKLTHLGLDLGAEIAERNLRSIAAAAAGLDNVLWVDMEGSAYTQVTLDLYRRVRADHANLGLCIQAYLRRTASDLESLIAIGSMVRLVKGAYAEPASIAFPSKSEVDESFLRLAERLLAPDLTGSRRRFALATHDLALIERIRRSAAARGIDRDALEIQMLYGIQREAQVRLAADGHPVRVLISFGSSWFPWYMRRLAERPANLTFVIRNLFAR
jgi:proline dehydrogenase